MFACLLILVLLFFPDRPCHCPAPGLMRPGPPTAVRTRQAGPGTRPGKASGRQVAPPEPRRGPSPRHSGGQGVVSDSAGRRQRLLAGRPSAWLGVPGRPAGTSAPIATRRWRTRTWKLSHVLESVRVSQQDLALWPPCRTAGSSRKMTVVALAASLLLRHILLHSLARAARLTCETIECC